MRSRRCCKTKKARLKFLTMRPPGVASGVAFWCLDANRLKYWSSQRGKTAGRMPFEAQGKPALPVAYGVTAKFDKINDRCDSTWSPYFRSFLRGRCSMGLC